MKLFSPGTYCEDTETDYYDVVAVDDGMRYFVKIFFARPDLVCRQLFRVPDHRHRL